MSRCCVFAVAAKKATKSLNAGRARINRQRRYRVEWKNTSENRNESDVTRRRYTGSRDMKNGSERDRAVLGADFSARGAIRLDPG